MSETVVTVLKETIGNVVYDFLSDGASYFYSFLDAFHAFTSIAVDGITQLGQFLSLFSLPSWLFSALFFTIGTRLLLKVWGRN